MRIAVAVSVSLLYLTILVLLVRIQWRRFRRQAPDGKLRYHITDIWAAMLGLFPTFWIVNETFEQFEAYSYAAFGLLIATPFILAAQLGGAIVGRLNIEIRALRIQADTTALQSAISIVAGCILGLACPMLAAGVWAAVILLR